MRLSPFGKMAEWLRRVTQATIFVTSWFPKSERILMDFVRRGSNPLLLRIKIFDEFFYFLLASRLLKRVWKTESHNSGRWPSG